jgi:hypothetical protein
VSCDDVRWVYMSSDVSHRSVCVWHAETDDRNGQQRSNNNGRVPLPRNTTLVGSVSAHACSIRAEKGRCCPTQRT